jgi:hypothetical protein
MGAPRASAASKARAQARFIKVFSGFAGKRV